MKRVLVSSLVCVDLLGFVGCATSTFRKIAPIELVPSTSVAVVSVNWTEVHQDPYLKRIIKGDGIEKGFGDLNISGDQVAKLVIFSDTQDATNGSSGIILSGSFKTRTVINRVKTQGWTKETYQRHKLYFNAADSILLAQLKSHLLVIGSRAGVEEVIDVRLDPQTGFASNEPFKKLTTRFSKKRYPISMILAFPQTYQDMGGAALEFSSVLLDFAGLGPLGTLLNKIGFARGLGCSISRTGSSFPVELVAIMKGETAAAFVSGSLNLLKGITGLFPQGNMSRSDRGAMKAFQSMSITRDGEILSIRMVMTEKDLRR